MTPQGTPATVLITSTKDPASSNMARSLIKEHGFESTRISLMGKPVFQHESLLLATIETDMTSPPDLDSFFNPRAYIFLSKHRAESGIPSLTVHTTGNFTDRPVLGARAREVGMMDPDLQKNYFIALKSREKELEGYEVTIEATHHGPTSLSRPVLFVELGSSEKDWEDQHAAKVIGDALIEALESGRSWDKVALAFGGNHYPSKFNAFLMSSDTALAAVVAKHSLEGVDSGMFGQMIQKSTRSPRCVVVDWKGMGQHKEKILALARQFALEVVRI